MLRACFAIWLVLAASFAFAQHSSRSDKKDYALIYVTVWGPDDRPVAGIPVKIRNPAEKKAKWQLVSDRSGELAQRVPVGPGDYIIQADVKVPKGQPQPEVTVHVDGNERRDIGLHLKQEELRPR